MTFFKALPYAALLGMILNGFCSQAQETAKNIKLSIKEAQDYAVKHNQTMRNADLEVQKAEYSKWQTIASMLPQVKAGFDYQNMCGYEMVMGGGGLFRPEKE